jgi:hypothetical protein
MYLAHPVKATVNGIPQLVVHKMTTEQVIIVEKNPELKNSPIELLRLINNSGTKILE